MYNKFLAASLLSGVAALALAPVASAQGIEVSEDGKAVAYTPTFATSSQMSSAQMESAQSRMPMLTDLSQLPNVPLLNESSSGFSNQAFGSFGGFPFTTRIVSQRPNSNSNSAPVDEAPYRQTGKLFMDFQGSFFV